jgi:hypothetical protein
VTGPEHYREAEKDLREAEKKGPDMSPIYLASAQANATLALAAAVALGTSAAESDAWADVAGTRLSGGG